MPRPENKIPADQVPEGDFGTKLGGQPAEMRIRDQMGSDGVPETEISYRLRKKKVVSYPGQKNRG